jgi:SAM-dependent methyltransferase
MTQTATFLIDKQDIQTIKNVISYLIGIDYHEKSVCERLGLADLTELSWRALPIFQAERLSGRNKLDLAIGLFLLQGSIVLAELDQLFDKPSQEALARSKLIFVNEKECFANVSLFPVGDSLIFSDHAWPKLPHPGFAEIPYDQVMYIGTDSRWLARTVPRKLVNSALDLCTGSGIHAILAAPYSNRVVAVDINPRAAQCTRLNALASGITNIEVVVGDLYEVVQDEKFDLITANPPFVPSPVNSLGFRDGGSSGEDVLERIVAGLPRYLANGGMAQIVTEFGERESGSFADRLRIWLGGAPIDILILQFKTEPASTYAIGHAQGDDSFAAYLDSVDDLRIQGYRQVVSAVIVFQWSNLTLGLPWTRIEEATSPHQDCADEIEAILYAERLARQPNLYQTLEYRQMHLAGSIGLIDARVLGAKVSVNAQAQLLEKTLTVLRQLTPAQRDVISLLEKSMTITELMTLTREIAIDDESTFLAVKSLIKNGLIALS